MMLVGRAIGRLCAVFNYRTPPIRCNVVIGVHTPELNYQKNPDNVREAIVRLDVPYPVAIDNAKQTWRAYHNRFWPATYLIDKAGEIRYLHIGEGGYFRTERIIEALLAKTPDG